MGRRVERAEAPGDVGGERLVDVVELEGDLELTVARAQLGDPRALRQRREREVAAEEARHRRREPDDRHPLRGQPQEPAGHLEVGERLAHPDAARGRW